MRLVKKIMLLFVAPVLVVLWMIGWMFYIAGESDDEG
jgi:CHASE3 domain sensor protein